jgi:hypothetical protein
MTHHQISENLGTDALFNQYITVVNRAIGQNKDGLYGKAVELWGKAVGDKPIAVALYKSDAQNPHHWYTVKLSNGTFDVVDASKRDDAAYDWKVSDKHIAEVVDNPKTYIDSPIKLDIDWLKTRVGLN